MTPDAADPRHAANAPTGALRVLVAGATGTIGRATVECLQARGHDVVCLARARPGRQASEPWTTRVVDFSDPASVSRDGVRRERFDAVVSCMASRTGAPDDAWAVDHDAHMHLLAAAGAAGAGHFVLLSAICVQKPRLAFQRAKLAFERALRESGLDWSIVRPTAYFKSLSGQIDRVLAGKPYLLFGDGEGTACKPIADEDLAAYMADCLQHPALRNAVLPIGGPGPALTPRAQGELLFDVAGIEPRFRHLPLAVMHGAVAVLGALGSVVPPLAEKAALARIGRYYATESMLVWDAEAGRYDADATPEYGQRTLGDYFRRRIAGEVADQRGEHAVL